MAEKKKPEHCFRTGRPNSAWARVNKQPLAGGAPVRIMGPLSGRFGGARGDDLGAPADQESAKGVRRFSVLENGPLNLLRAKIGGGEGTPFDPRRPGLVKGANR